MRSVCKSKGALAVRKVMQNALREEQVGVKGTKGGCDLK